MTKCVGLLMGGAALGVGVCVAAAAFAPAAPPGSPRIEDLAWLTGGWSMTSGDVTVEEPWIAPAGGTMLAVGRTLKKERTLFFEFLRIETRKDGLVYVAQPKGVSPGTDFKLTTSKEHSAKFENPEHDNPKSLEYTLQPDGSLAVHLEGEEDGKPAHEDFHYSRIAK